MLYKGCKYCFCEDCPNDCKKCNECNEGIDGIGYCRTYRELEENRQLSLFATTDKN